jgi:hypothetical protein
VEGPCEHGNEPSGSINVGIFLSGCATGSFSRRAQLHTVFMLTDAQLPSVSDGIR